MRAPVCLFTYNRFDETKQAVEALQRNYLAKETDLVIFSDGPESSAAKPQVEAVRQFLKTVEGFKSIEIVEASTNKGLANSIIDGVTNIIGIHGKVIVLEDDLITSPNFLDFMNQALEFYADDKNIFSVSGYTLNLPTLHDYDKDYYLGYRASSWGWSTWIDRWQDVDWTTKEYDRFKWNPVQQIRFMRGGSDMPRMLRKQMTGKIDSWAIRWCFDQFNKDLLTVFASKSKLISIGFGADATHTKRSGRFNTDLSSGEQTVFAFDKSPVINKALIAEFRNKFSFFNRLKEKIFK